MLVFSVGILFDAVYFKLTMIFKIVLHTKAVTDATINIGDINEYSSRITLRILG